MLLDNTHTQGLLDKDPYVVKTSATAVAKLFAHDPVLVRAQSLLPVVQGLLSHANLNFVSYAIAALMDVAQSKACELGVDVPTANRFLTAVDDAGEWAQIGLLGDVMTVSVDGSQEAEALIERICPRLQHSVSIQLRR